MNRINQCGDPVRVDCGVDAVTQVKNMAITFAESGLPHDAVGFLELYDHKNRGFNASIAEELGLHGVRVLYGTVSF